MKICYLCHTDKPATDFYKDRTRPDGLSSRCKECDKLKIAKYQTTSNGKATRKRYRQSTKGRLAKQRDDKRYYQTERGRRARFSAVQRYEMTDKARLVHQQSARRRRERKRSLDLQFTAKDAKIVYERFGNVCFNCGGTDRLQIDHNKPLSLGYGLSLSNAVLLCKSCNSSKHDKMPEDFYSLEQLLHLRAIFNHENSCFI